MADLTTHTCSSVAAGIVVINSTYHGGIFVPFRPLVGWTSLVATTNMFPIAWAADRNRQQSIFDDRHVGNH